MYNKLNSQLIVSFMNDGKPESYYNNCHYVNIEGLHLLFESSWYGSLVRQVSYDNKVIDICTCEINKMMDFIGFEENEYKIFSAYEFMDFLKSFPNKIDLIKKYMID
jgi:hypothetical protein